MPEFDISPTAAHTVDIDLQLIAPQAGAAPPTATATMIARAPTVTAVRHATVNAVRAVATGSASIVLPGGSEAGFVNPLRISSTGFARVPALAVDATVQAVIATSTSTVFVPGSPTNVNMTAVRAASTASPKAPTVSGETVLTGGGPGTGNLIAIPPSSVTGTAGASPPAFASVGATTGLTGTHATLPVPPGVVGVASECILAFLFVQDGTQTITPPTGFTELVGSPIVVAGVEAHALRGYWKRPTAADTGTYDFAYSAGLTGIGGFAARFTGCLASGTPVTGSGFADADASNATTPAASVATGPNRLAVWAVSDFNGQGTTFSGGFTERGDDLKVAVATLPVVSAGNVPPSGSLQATTTSAFFARQLAWLGTLLSPGFPP